MQGKIFYSPEDGVTIPTPVEGDLTHLNDDPLNFAEEDIDDMTDDSPIINAVVPEPVEPEEETEVEAEGEPAPVINTTAFKLGEIEYEPEQLEKIIKAHDDMSNWEKNLRNFSHLKNMDPKLAEAMVPYINSQKEIPKGLVEEPIITSVTEGLKDFQIEIPYEDLDGKEATLSVDIKTLKPLIDKAIALTTLAYQPELDKSAALTERVRVDRINEMLTAFTSNESAKEMFTFHVGKNVSLYDHIRNVMDTPGHIDAEPVKRLKALVDQVDGQDIKTLDDAYQFIYKGKKLQSTATVLGNIVKRQSNGKGLDRGTELKPDTAIDMDIDKNSAEDVLKSLGV